jgi:hypothetical protein
MKNSHETSSILPQKPFIHIQTPQQQTFQSPPGINSQTFSPQSRSSF